MSLSPPTLSSVVAAVGVDACATLEEQGIQAAHFDLRFVKPLDADLLHDVFQRFQSIITVEDASLMGGFGSAILEFMGDHQYNSQVKRLGIPDKIVEHGSQAELHRESGFDAEGIVHAAVQLTSTHLA